MTPEIILVFIILGIAFLLFTTELISFDLSALIILVLLITSGILDVKEGLAGFSHPATLTITFMFILSEGIRGTGILTTIGNYFKQHGGALGEKVVEQLIDELIRLKYVSQSGSKVAYHLN